MLVGFQVRFGGGVRHFWFSLDDFRHRAEAVPISASPTGRPWAAAAHGGAAAKYSARGWVQHAPAGSDWSSGRGWRPYSWGHRAPTLSAGRPSRTGGWGRMWMGWQSPKGCWWWWEVAVGEVQAGGRAATRPAAAHQSTCRDPEASTMSRRALCHTCTLVHGAGHPPSV